MEEIVSRYRIYMILKWLFVIASIYIVLYLFAALFVFGSDDEAVNRIIVVYALQGIGCSLIAIFFKLQENSNEPSD